MLEGKEDKTVEQMNQQMQTRWYDAYFTYHHSASADSNVRRTERIFEERENITEVYHELHTNLRIKKVSNEAKSRYMTQLRVTPLYRGQ
jgi:hypothetical protein